MIALLLTLFITTLCHAETLDHVKVIAVHDGDTFSIDLPNEPNIFGNHIPVRIYGIDAPEISSKDSCEHLAASKAKDLVQSHLNQAKNVSLRDVKRDKYFRILADVYIDNKPIKDLLLQAKLAYPYFGKTKQKRNWCQ